MNEIYLRLKEDSFRPCDICGHYYYNKIEPRFGYTLCYGHRDVPPTKVHNLRREIDTTY